MEKILYDIIKNAQIPALVPVHRQYPDTSLADIPGAVNEALEKSGIVKGLERLPRHAEIAVAVGSRGIANLSAIVTATVSWFKQREFSPFIIPAMGSHGGATASGQSAVLRELGITEDRCGCPVRATMEVKQVGTLPEALPVYIDAFAAGAPALFVLNRVKPHTGFTGKHESGLAKMITIGLGKQIGADACHSLGFSRMAELVQRMAQVSLQTLPIIGGLGIVENAHDKTAVLEAAPADELLACDARLLLLARSMMPSLPFKHIHVLIIDEMGKDISGAGLDGNITGRFATPYISNDTRVNKLAVLDLTAVSEGNATGMGNADIITQRLLRAVDFVPTYANSLTSTLFKSAFVPFVADTDENAFRCAIKTSNAGREPLRLIRIKNTLHVAEMLLSPALAAELRGDSQYRVGDKEISQRFATDGTLLERDVWSRFETFFYN